MLQVEHAQSLQQPLSAIVLGKCSIAQEADGVCEQPGVDDLSLTDES